MARKKNQRAADAGTTGASIYAVARQAGVSIVTVSRVFNDYPHVSQRMRHRVFEAARIAGYTPRLVSKPNVLAVIIGHLDHLSAGDYKTRLLLFIVQAAAKCGYLVEFIPYDSVDLATKHLVDGILEVGLTDEEAAKLASLPQVPTILTNKKSPRPAWSTVSSDHAHEGYAATRHLVERGHRQVALIVDDPAGWGVEQRQAGCARALKACGARPLVLCSAELSAGDVAREMMRAKCTACVNFTDNFGFAVLDHCAHELKLRIPDDLSVVCLENASVSPFWNPRLTTFEQPLREIADAAVRGILELLDKPGGRFDRVIKGRLIERGSVRTL